MIEARRASEARNYRPRLRFGLRWDEGKHLVSPLAKNSCSTSVIIQASRMGSGMAKRTDPLCVRDRGFSRPRLPASGPMLLRALAIRGCLVRATDSTLFNTFQHFLSFLGGRLVLHGPRRGARRVIEPELVGAATARGPRYFFAMFTSGPEWPSSSGKRGAFNLWTQVGSKQDASTTLVGPQ
jgi:hypothetical protein